MYTIHIPYHASSVISSFLLVVVCISIVVSLLRLLLHLHFLCTLSSNYCEDSTRAFLVNRTTYICERWEKEHELDALNNTVTIIN